MKPNLEEIEASEVPTPLSCPLCRSKHLEPDCPNPTEALNRRAKALGLRLRWFLEPDYQSVWIYDGDRKWPDLHFSLKHIDGFIQLDSMLLLMERRRRTPEGCVTAEPVHPTANPHPIGC